MILCGFIFDFINGFHDAANSIATIVTTGVLTPKQAVLWAAFFNFIAFAIFNLSVAETIGNGLIDPSVLDSGVIFAALCGAIVWNLITWYYGLPSSSSHALVGGLIGVASSKAGLLALKLPGLIKIFLGIVVTPLLGMLVGLLITLLLQHITKYFKQEYLHRKFKWLQLFSSALLSVTHGGNDAQKTMGIIAGLLFSASWIGDIFYVPFWVIISCQAVISLGTLVGGWRIINTMGTQITELNPLNGCAVETGSAMIIFLTTQQGVPVSTTHIVTGAIAGVGMVHGFHGTQWPLLCKIFLTWMMTIPAAALVAIGVYYASLTYLS